MKRILLTLIAFTTALVQQAGASVFQPELGLGAIRTEIVNQQVIVSNAPALDKPLATALRAALLQIDRTTPTNLVNDTKALQNVTAKLNNTSLSNTFDPLIRTALANYAGVVIGSLNSVSNSLLLTFPSRSRNAADNLIDSGSELVQSAVADGNTTTGTKVLAGVVKKLAALNNLLNKAINAPAPPTQFRATITATGEGTFNWQPTPARAASASLVGNLLTVVGIQAQRTGGTTARARTLTVNFPNVTDGTHVYNVSGNGGDATIIYAVTEGGVGVPPSGNVFNATSGTATLTWNSATRSGVATFTFSGPGANGGSASGANGVLSVDVP